MPGLRRKASCKEQDLIGMIVKKHTADGKVVLAICDEDILGKYFEDEKAVLDLTSKFYAGSEKNTEELLEMIKEAYIINCAGHKTIEFLKKHNLVDDKTVIRIGGIPFAQIVFLEE